MEADKEENRESTKRENVGAKVKQPPVLFSKTRALIRKVSE